MLSDLAAAAQRCFEAMVSYEAVKLGHLPLWQSVDSLLALGMAAAAHYGNGFARSWS